jgi:microsomal dipeptidase-like Zn-dependent dipeptidase
MATVYLIPASTTVGPKTASEPRTIRAAAVLTDTYAASTDAVVTLGWDYVLLGLDYTEGSETTIQIKAQGSDGTTYRDLGYKATQGSTVSEITPDVIQLTAATFATAYGSNTIGRVWVGPIDVRGCQLFRTVQKANAGSTDGTLAITVVGGISPVGSRSLL